MMPAETTLPPVLSFSAVQENLEEGTVLGTISPAEEPTSGLAFLIWEEVIDYEAVFAGGLVEIGRHYEVSSHFDIVDGTIYAASPLDYEAGSLTLRLAAEDPSDDDTVPTLTLTVIDVDEFVYGTKGKDRMIGGDGLDQFDGGGGNDVLKGGVGDDALRGGTGNDILYGEDGVDHLEGGAGNDRLYGGTYIDHLFGGDGDDILDGGWDGNTTEFEIDYDADMGPNELTGGRGADTLRDTDTNVFIFQSVLDSKIKTFDKIIGWAGGSIIDMNMIDADKSIAGNQDFTWLGKAKFSGASGELRYATSGDKTFVTADIDGDRQSDFKLQIIGIHKTVTLTSDDFHL